METKEGVQGTPRVRVLVAANSESMVTAVTFRGTRNVVPTCSVPTRRLGSPKSVRYRPAVRDNDPAKCIFIKAQNTV